MSQFKFSCPACGQHLAGDLGYVGRQITCPTCQQPFTVPGPEPATAPAAAALHPAAPPVPPPPPPSASAGPAGPPPPVPAPMPLAGRASPKTSGLAVASLVCSCAGLVFGPLGFIPGIICGHLARGRLKRDPSLAGRGLATAGLVVGYGVLALFIGVVALLSVLFKGFKASLSQGRQRVLEVRQAGEPAAPLAATAPDSTPEASGWTLQLEGVEIPSQPAQGRLHGRPFTPQQVVMENGWLKFRQGRDFFPDLELSVVLFEENPSNLADRIFKVPGERGPRPHVWLHWKEPGQTVPQTKAFVDRYALRLEFGRLSDGKLPGKIYVCVPDETRSFLRGSFEVELKPGAMRPGGRAPRQRAPVAPPSRPKAEGGPV